MGTLSEASKAYLAALNLVQVKVLGGNDVVSDSVVSEINTLLEKTRLIEQ